MQPTSKTRRTLARLDELYYGAVEAAIDRLIDETLGPILDRAFAEGLTIDQEETDRFKARHGISPTSPIYIPLSVILADCRARLPDALAAGSWHSHTRDHRLRRE